MAPADWNALVSGRHAHAADKPIDLAAKLSVINDSGSLWSRRGQLVGVMQKGRFVAAEHFIVRYGLRPEQPATLIRKRQRTAARVGADGGVALHLDSEVPLIAVWDDEGRLEGVMHGGIFITADDLLLVGPRPVRRQRL